MKKIRQDYEQPESIAKWGWKYHHLGLPTDKAMPGETYIPEFKLYVAGFSESPFGIEWMRYEVDSPVNKLIQTQPHIAFQVDDVDKEISAHSFKVITEPNSPSDKIRVAMIEHHGAVIELIEFVKNR
jgi:hypothetical protein